jgi:hypothetical protein
MLISGKYSDQLGRMFFALVFLFSFNVPLYANGEKPAEAVTENASAARPGKSPLILNISKDARDSRVALDYSVRWDFSDLSGLKPGVKMLYSIFKSASSWDITENTRLKYYGFKTNPWRVFLAKDKPAAADASGATAGNSGGARAGHEKRLRLSLSPLVDDFRKNLDENLKDALLNLSFKQMPPELSKLSASNKKMLVKDVLSVFNQ